MAVVFTCVALLHQRMSNGLHRCKHAIISSRQRHPRIMPTESANTNVHIVASQVFMGLPLYIVARQLFGKKHGSHTTGLCCPGSVFPFLNLNLNYSIFDHCGVTFWIVSSHSNHWPKTWPCCKLPVIF